MAEGEDLKEGLKTFAYRMVSWREGSEVLNVNLGPLQEDGCQSSRAEGSKDEK